jgi:hypothetical protein
MPFAISSASSAIYANSPYANAMRASRATQQGGVSQAVEQAAKFLPGNTKQPEQTNQTDGSQQDDELSDEDLRRLDRMKADDRAVRAHEAAHMAAGGSLITSGASFKYETGPDGQRYAVAGDVGIDTSKGRTPEDTLARAQQVRAAALAPADPSGQDRAVAAAAGQMATEARAEIAQAAIEENSETPDDEEKADLPELPAIGLGSRGINSPDLPFGIGSGSRAANDDDASAFGQMIARSLTPFPVGREINIYA